MKTKTNLGKERVLVNLQGTPRSLYPFVLLTRGSAFGSLEPSKQHDAVLWLLKSQAAPTPMEESQPEPTKAPWGREATGGKNPQRRHTTAAP